MVLFVRLLPRHIRGIDYATKTYGIWVGALGLLTALCPPLGPITAFFGLGEAVALTLNYEHCFSVG